MPEEILKDHEMSHSGTIKKKFSCTKCDNTFTSKGELETHLKSHNEHYGCKKCEQTFQNLRALKTHEQKHKDSETQNKLLKIAHGNGDEETSSKLFCCSVCDKEFMKG